MAVLERERTFYDTQKADLLKTHLHQFALIHDDQLLGVFGSFKEAYTEGVRRFGLKPFLVQQIKEVEPVGQHPALVVGAIAAR